MKQKSEDKVRPRVAVLEFCLWGLTAVAVDRFCCALPALLLGDAFGAGMDRLRRRTFVLS